jgi:hypothetical protein
LPFAIQRFNLYPLGMRTNIHLMNRHKIIKRKEMIERKKKKKNLSNHMSI